MQQRCACIEVLFYLEKALGVGVQEREQFQNCTMPLIFGPIQGTFTIWSIEVIGLGNAADVVSHTLIAK